MTDMPTVVRHDQITSAWLSAALQGRGIDATVADFDIEGVGTGQLGETKRFLLHYQGTPPANAPCTVVGKFPSDNAVAAATGRDLGFYRAEVMFYRELAHRAVIHTPQVYVAELAADSGNFVLLLEDMAPARCGDHMQGCSVDDANKALNEAAMLHAAFWNDSELERQPWLYVPPGAQGFYTTELLESSWEYFVANYAAQMDPQVIKVCEKFVRCHAAWNAPRSAPKCFSHNDFRVDNMLFGAGRICVVDWQTSAYLGSGMDVAYFLGSAFDRDTRRAVERDLLKQYLAELHRRGVCDYDFEQLMADYRHYSFAVLVVAIAATVIVKKTERGDRLFMKMVADGAYQAIDNDAVDALPS